MIREETLKGKSPYAISNELGISKNTAKRYATESVKPHGLKGRSRGSKLDEYKHQVGQFIAQGLFNCVVIYERLKCMGYTGGISILKEYVHQFRPPKNHPAVRRFETLPGKQAQMDWGITQYIDDDGSVHKAPAFVMVLGKSRVRYVEFTKRCDYYSLVRCMVHAFEYFGGVPEVVLTDNMKTVIDGREAGKPLWNSKFEDFAADMGFIPKVCRVRRPQTKGKVERLVQYVKNNFLPGRPFHDLDDLNHQALEWCNDVNGKVHGTTGRIPLEDLKLERLQALPDKAIRDKYRWETRKVTRDGFISFDGAKYGVPWQYSGKELRVRLYDNFFEAYDGEVLIVQQKIEHTSGRMVWLKGQYQGLAEKKGIAVSFSYARKAIDAVEVRPLSIYDEIAGVVSHA